MPPRKRRVRGHVEQLPSGSYRAVVYGGIDPLTGRECRVREVCKTYAAAEKALTKLQRQVDEDQHPKSGEDQPLGGGGKIIAVCHRWVPSR